MANRDFFRVTHDELKALQPGDRVFVAQCNADNPDPLRSAIHWCQVTRCDEKTIHAAPIWDGRLTGNIVFDIQQGLALRMPNVMHGPSVGILAVDNGPKFNLDQSSLAIRSFIERSEAAIKNADMTLDVLTAVRNAKAYLSAQDIAQLAGGNPTLAAKALFANMNLGTVERLVELRGNLVKNLTEDGPLVCALRGAHDLINEHWAVSNTAQGQLGVRVLNDLRVAMSVVTKGPESAISQLPITALNGDALKDAFKATEPKTTFHLSSTDIADDQVFDDAAAAGRAFYQVERSRRPSVIISYNPRKASTLASTEVWGNDEQGAPRYVKRTPGVATPEAAAFSSGYFQALALHVESQLKAVDWTASASEAGLSEQAPALGCAVYDDLESLSRFDFETAAQLWDSHVPAALGRPAMLDRQWKRQLEGLKSISEQLDSGSTSIYLDAESEQPAPQPRALRLR
ncbi:MULTISPECIES: hypothetical protein [Ectopseudomonas]|uniref:Uncharacterized protein n=2 Tax=Ectopseudomonas TaxID=3236654 RepID=A0A1G6Q6P6_9GAMM|nr:MULTISPECIES: hypothetical protein [Pseudomonas]ALN21717.1 hypothetical protein DW68_023840 [Pseudomonas mendocina S5.2]KER98216.1 hypothetical protein HN51_25895 [Pseudomonas mendocina]MBP3062111.1 hypothetical protein [Pseudomonas chengduensis]NNB75403.1 hypothetical protein [Pseudomonas chengduensis]OEO24346.1 hypothetical protein AX279_16880 [Pseudomonas sp. J237]